MFKVYIKCVKEVKCFIALISFDFIQHSAGYTIMEKLGRPKTVSSRIFSSSGGWGGWGVVRGSLFSLHFHLFQPSLLLYSALRFNDS